ncbi:ABC transporter permease [Pendulispora rubella]|uniref:Autoinducer 2 import system permease protein LsrC n=1 Tax=Pendulispora rubella TaxID=2741070 RepID=A0ABZ2LFH8_9BACT
MTGLLEWARRIRELGILLALGLVVLVTAMSNPLFVSGQSVRDLLLNTSLVALLTVGQTMVVLTRNVDLSVGSVLGLSAFLTAGIFVRHPELSIPVGLAIGVVVGAACGALNGALVAVGRVPSLVVTLGTLYVFRGLDYAWAQGKQINAGDLPDALLAMGGGRFLGVPYLVLITLVVIAVAALHLHGYRSGRELYAIGSNPEAAVLAGIAVRRRVLTAFVASGAVAGLAGTLWAARYGTVDATAGTGLELQVVSAVVVGGVAIFGGSGTVTGAALGALLLTTISSALIVLRIPAFWQQAITGALLLAAIALDRIVALRLAATLRRRSRGVSA